MIQIEDILGLVDEYIKQTKKNNVWVPGKDLVQYAGDYFNSDEYVAAVSTLLKGWLVLGNEGTKFENKFPKLFDKKLGILTNSGSSANLLMLSALTSSRGYNLPKGTKVLTPIAGFPTTINPIIQLGFQPVFVDIELDTLNLDLDHVEKVLDKHPDIKVITFAHVLGNPPDMDRLMSIVENNGQSVLTPTNDVWKREIPYYIDDVDLWVETMKNDEIYQQPNLLFYSYKNNKYPHAGAGVRVQF